MIKFVGSNYQYSGEVLTQPEIIFVEDHHYNEVTKSFPIKQLLENSQCDPHQHILVFDHVLQHDDELKEYCQIHLPLFLAQSCRQFLEKKIVPDWTDKTCTFNFMINKIRQHRSFLLMLLEHFELTDYRYTLCWKNNNVNRSRMIDETDNVLYQAIINKARLDIPNQQYLFGTENLLEQGLQYGNITNAEVYQTFLQKAVFEPTCISLITEPAFYERETIITEKTLMSVFAGTVPIWIGGWRIADWMRSRGFDVFDDIVDHSYQELSDPYDRCYAAIEKNIDLLRDTKTIMNFVNQNSTRFKNNLALVNNNIFQLECREIVKQNPNLGMNLF